MVELPLSDAPHAVLPLMDRKLGAYMRSPEIPVEIAGYINKRLPTYDAATGEVIHRWWSVKRGMMPMDFNHFICTLLRGQVGALETMGISSR